MSVDFNLEDDAQTHIFKLFNPKEDFKLTLSWSVWPLVCLLSGGSEQWCLVNILARIIACCRSYLLCGFFVLFCFS